MSDVYVLRLAALRILGVYNTLNSLASLMSTKNKDEVL